MFPEGCGISLKDAKCSLNDAICSLNDAKCSLKQGLEGKLDSKDWVVACDGLNTLRRLAIHNREELRPQTGPAVLLCFKSVKNLRSAVQRSALICLQDIVVIYGDAVLASLSVGKPPNLQQILLRAAQDKRFVADEAERLLQLIAENCDSGLFLDDLLPFVENKSPKVRMRVVCKTYSQLNSMIKSVFGMCKVCGLVVKDA
jgi:hypothetical protein